MSLETIDVIQQAREEPEEWLLLRELDRRLMGLGKNQDDDRQNFGEIMDLGWQIRSISIVLDHEHYQTRQCIDGLIGGAIITRGSVLGPLLDACFGAYAEEERGNIFSLEDAFISELHDIISKRLFGRWRTLEDSDPIIKMDRETLGQKDELGV